MGMYTEFILGCELMKETPKVCINAMMDTINGTDENDTPEVNAFIDEYDFGNLFQCESYYFGAPRIGKMYYDNISGTYRVSTRANLKNHNKQIEKFVSYIRQYVTSGSGMYTNIFAYSQYEEDLFPQIYTTHGVYVPNIKDIGAYPDEMPYKLISYDDLLLNKNPSNES